MSHAQRHLMRASGIKRRKQIELHTSNPEYGFRMQRSNWIRSCILVYSVRMRFICKIERATADRADSVSISPLLMFAWRASASQETRFERGVRAENSVVSPVIAEAKKVLLIFTNAIKNVTAGSTRFRTSSTRLLRLTLVLLLCFASGSAAILYTSCILVGIFINSSVPIFFELFIETVYPVPEGITCGVVTFLQNLFTGLLLFFLSFYCSGESNGGFRALICLHSRRHILPSEAPA